MTRNRYSTVSFVAAINMAAAVPALAQSATEMELTEIVVTARRVEERLQDVPISIAVLNQKELTDRNIFTAGDLATYVPSLSVSTRFGAESTTFALRGFTQEAQTAQSVAVYFADVVAPRAQGGTPGGNGAGVGSFFDLQNVQVLRGPQGTLFGRNTTGGALLLVPQKPTGDFEGYVEAGAGNHEMRRAQGVLNVPFGDSVRFRLGADSQEREGYLTNKSGIGPKDFNDVSYWAVRASLVVDVTPNVENYTIASFSDSDTNGFYLRMVLCNRSPTQGAALIIAPLACAQVARQDARGDDLYDVENGNAFAAQHIRQRQIVNTTTWQATDALTLKNIASHSEFKQAQTGNIFGENFRLGASTPFTYVGLFKNNGVDNISQWTFTEEIQLQGRTADSKLTWQGGLYYEKSGPLDGFQGTLAPILASCTNPNTFQCFDPIGMAMGTTLGTVQESMTEYRFRSLGAYAQLTYAFTDQLSLTTGIRYTSDRVESLGRIRTITFPTPNTPVFRCGGPPRAGAAANDPAVCQNELNQESEEPTWVVDFKYTPLDSLMAYAKYARGYRQGGVNTSNTAFASWEPEQLDMYEIGAKATFDGVVRGSLNIAAFYNDFSDQQLAAVAVAIPGSGQAPAQGIVNAGKSRIQGVEVDASIVPFEGLLLSAGYAYLDTKLEEFQTPAFDTTRFLSLAPTAVVGGDLILSPNHKLSISGTYTLPLPESIGKLSLGATYTYTDEQISSSQSPIGTLPSSNLVNVNLNWEEIVGAPIDLAIFATNVGDKEYVTAVGGSYGSTGFETVLPGEPRMYGARLRYRFGN